MKVIRILTVVIITIFTVAIVPYMSCGMSFRCNVPEDVVYWDLRNGTLAVAIGLAWLGLLWFIDSRKTNDCENRENLWGDDA